MRPSQVRHLLFLAHLWACAPFLLVWLLRPDLLVISSNPDVAVPLRAVWAGLLLYLVVRTVLALVDPPRLRWDYVFPPIDVVLVTVALYFRREADSSILVLYFFPIIEAASTMSVSWAALIGALSVAGALGATWSGPSGGTFGLAFRLYSMVLVASLVTTLTRRAAELRAELATASERNRIALEMHDGVQGLLSSIAVLTEIARRLAPTDGAKASEVAGECHGVARQASDELRFLVSRLRSPLLGAQFCPSLQTYVEHFGQRNNLRVSFTVHGEPHSLSPEIEHALFRMVQEALNNVAKHASAGLITVQIQFEQHRLEVRVKDDGSGMPPATLAATSAGLQGMRDRAAEVGGTISFHSGEEGGTTVLIQVPTSSPTGAAREGRKR